MSKFVVNLPEEIIREIESVSNNIENICDKMLKDAAEVVYKNVMNNMPTSLKRSNFSKTIKVTKTYKTPSDKSINRKILVINGYFTNHLGKRTPAPLIANIFEYGRSRGKGVIPKRPFFRKSFKKNEIELALYKAQLQASGGLLKK